MEVHQHSHLASGETHTPRKKWTHYFWEFLMLFLAVFCGFLAEYQLEHVIERKREVQYIRSLIEDLRLDTTGFSFQIQLRNQREKGADSLILMLNSSDKDKYLNSIYFRGMRLGRGNLFLYNDRTIAQLKSSGGMRLIRKQKVSDSMIGYDNLIRNMQLFEMKDEEAADKYRDIAAQVFDASVFRSMIDTSDENRIIRPEGNPKLLTNNPEIINRLCVWAIHFRISNHQVIVHQIKLKAQAVRLMEFLRKEYKLE